MQHILRPPLLLAFALLSFFVSACHTPKPDAGFVENPGLLKANDDDPFDAVWFKSGVDLRTYKKISVAPVDTTHLLKMSWWDKASLADTTGEFDPDKEVKVLADYLRNSVIAAFRADPETKYEILDTPDDETLIVELAIVEVVPTKVWLNAISYVVAGALDTGETAIEGRFRDGKTKEVIFSFKDSREGRFAIVSVDDLTWYSHARDTLDIWADLIVKICDRSPNEAVSSPIGFTLKPW